jgi:4-amino-4-deoxy-L-arabinose transferase
MPVDHNDIAFMYYTCGSIWAYSEYSISEKRKWHWAVLVGVCAGCAVLCKWLTGMFVFSGWGLALLTQKDNRSLLQNWLHIIAAFVVSCAVFMPWQIYTHFKFPQESTYERAYNSRHLVEALEGHDGNWKFYFTQSDS